MKIWFILKIAHALAIIDTFFVLYKAVDSSCNDESGIAIDRFNDLHCSLNYKGRKFVDIGINKPISYFGKMRSGTRIAVKIIDVKPKFTIKEISKEDVKDYWGYKVKERGNLFSTLSSWSGKIILTSKKGKIFTAYDAVKFIKPNDSILLVFGTTNKGIHEILGTDIKKVQNSKILNFFPNQATQTVRLEEAILGTLSVINFYNYNKSWRM